MIRNIAAGPGIVVQGGHSNQVYLNQSPPGNPASGTIRYNNNNIEVYDGNSWWPISQPYTNISLENELYETLQWARKKMQEERELEELAKQYPILEDAMRDLEVIKVLVRGKRNHDIQQS